MDIFLTAPEKVDDDDDDDDDVALFNKDDLLEITSDDDDAAEGGGTGDGVAWQADATSTSIVGSSCLFTALSTFSSFKTCKMSSQASKLTDLRRRKDGSLCFVSSSSAVKFSRVSIISSSLRIERTDIAVFLLKALSMKLFTGLSKIPLNFFLHLWILMLTNHIVRRFHIYDRIIHGRA